jgi:hypothetical protein
MAALACPDHVTAQDYEVPPLSEYTDDGFGSDLSFYGYFNGSYHGLGHGGGALFGYPLMPNGFIGGGEYRDALHLEGGLDLHRWVYKQADEYVSQVILAADLGLRYAVYTNDWFAPLASFRTGLGLPLTDHDTSFFWSLTLGVLMDLSDILSVRIEFGWGRYHETVRLGVLIRL